MRQIIITFVIFYLVCISVLEIKAQVVINEILTCNTSTNLDLKNKEFSDWIELYNYSDKEISIGNWYLTDNKTEPTKWEIPFYYSIAPKGFKLFWVDKLGTANHTNFKLNVDGESIYLFNKESILVDSISYPPQVPDVSYGRVAGFMNQLMYFNEATPMEKNLSHGNKTLDFAGEPIFSKKAGFYEDLFQLELSVVDNTDKIFYTTDGSKPTSESNQYLQAIEINKNTIIRARIYSINKLPGKVITQTYLIKESCSLPVVSLGIDPKYLWDQNIGIYVKGVTSKKNKGESTEYAEFWEPTNYFQSWERPINVEYFDVNGDQGFNINAGVKIHGRSSRTYAQKSLAIFAREKYGTPTIVYKLFGEKSPDEIKSFLLRNGGNDWGMTMFLDGLVHTLVIDKIDLDAQLYQPAIVFLNGKYWGIHNIREKINKNYIKTKYQIDSSRLDIIETDGLAKKLVASCGNFEQYNRMINFIENNELSIKENYDTVNKWIDIYEFINYLVTQVYISNRDWPQSNMKFWKVKDESGKWRWILYDTEFAFVESSKYCKFNILEHMFAENSEFHETTPCSNFLIRKLFESDEFRLEFIQRMAVYLHTVFDTDHVLNVLDSLKRNIEPEFKRNQEKWGGIKQETYPFLKTCSSHSEWETNIKYIREFIENRPSKLRENMLEYFNLKDTVNLKLRVSDPIAGKISLMGITLEKGDFKAYIFADIPIRLEAIPNKGYEFVKWEGGDFEKKCVISINKNKKFTAIFKKIE